MKISGLIQMAFGLAVTVYSVLVLADVVPAERWFAFIVLALGVYNLGVFFKGLYDRRDVGPTGINHA